MQPKENAMMPTFHKKALSMNLADFITKVRKTPSTTRTGSGPHVLTYSHNKDQSKPLSQASLISAIKILRTSLGMMEAACFTASMESWSWSS